MLQEGLCLSRGYYEKMDSPGGFDLHTHSTCSDGTATPREIAFLAHKIGLAGFSLSDHDTVAGWGEARAACKQLGLEFLPGIEITTVHAGVSQHLLAYGTREADARLYEELRRLVSRRAARTQKMRVLLQRDFNLGRLDDTPVGQSTGRPHLADALVRAGYFRDRTAAFAGPLKPGSPYYIPVQALETVHAIELVREAGGVSVLAHPVAYRMKRPTTVTELRQFARHGLVGVELEHPENREAWLPPLSEEAKRLGLIVTGASDFHGAGKENVLGECKTGFYSFNRIREMVENPS